MLILKTPPQGLRFSILRQNVLLFTKNPGKLAEKYYYLQKIWAPKSLQSTLFDHSPLWNRPKIAFFSPAALFRPVYTLFFFGALRAPSHQFTLVKRAFVDHFWSEKAHFFRPAAGFPYYYLQKILESFPKSTIIYKKSWKVWSKSTIVGGGFKY